MNEKTPAYPESWPSEEIRELVRIVRAGRLLEEREVFAHHAWVVQGFLQRLVLGEPATVIGAEGSRAIEAAPEEAICEALLTGPVTSMSANGALPLPASLLLSWLVRKLLEALLTARREA